MSKREKISADLSAYLDGELNQARRSKIEKVLQYDKDLAGELERLKATRRLIGDLPGKNPPADFVGRVVARGERMHLLIERRSKMYWWIPTISAAAAVLLAAAGAVTIIFHQYQAAGPVEHAGEPVITLARADKEIDAPESEVAPVAAPLLEGQHFAKKDSSVTKLPAPSPQNVEIYTDNLALAQRDVINVLAANNIQRQAHVTDGYISNTFHSNIETTRQVQYIAFVPANQMGKLRRELNSVIAKQKGASLGFQEMDKATLLPVPATMPTTRVAGRRLKMQQAQQVDNVKLTITLNLDSPSPQVAPAADEKK